MWGKGVRASSEKTKGHTDIVEASTEEEPELLPEGDIQKPESGDTRSILCDIDCRSPRELKHHIKNPIKVKCYFSVKYVGRDSCLKKG